MPNVLSVSIPSLLANGGTTLLWAAETQHLLFGNAIIGVVEALVIAWVFHVRRGWLLLAMIPANYFSTFVALHYGHRVSDWLSPRLLEPSPLEHVNRFVVAILLLVFVESVVLEWPFVFAAFHGQQRRLPRSVLACVLAQTVSYSLLVPFYWSASTNTLGHEVKVVRTVDFAANKKATVLFISRDDQNVYAVRLDGSAPFIFRSFLPSQMSLPVWFSLRQEMAGRRATGIRRLQSGTIEDLERGVVDSTSIQGEGRPDGVIDQRPVGKRDWEVMYISPRQGFMAWNNKTKQDVRVRVDVPGLAWGASFITVLPDDQAVFEFGGQIVLCDLSTRRIATLAKGGWPIVLLGSEWSPATATTSP